MLRAGARIPDGSHPELREGARVRGRLRFDCATWRRATTGSSTALAHDDVLDAALRSDSEVALDLLLTFGAELPADFIARAAAFGAHTHLRAALRDAAAITSAGPSSNHCDAMCLAAAYGRLEAMQLLADAGVPIEPREPGATSPLIWSVWSAALDGDACRATAWLLERGAAIDAVDARRRPALAFAMNGCRATARRSSSSVAPTSRCCPPPLAAPSSSFSPTTSRPASAPPRPRRSRRPGRSASASVVREAPTDWLSAIHPGRARIRILFAAISHT